MSKLLTVAVVAMLLLVSLIGSVPRVVAQDNAQEPDVGATSTPEGMMIGSPESTTSIYLPLIVGGQGGSDAGQNQQETKIVASIVLGEEPQIKTAEKPTDAQDNISQGQVPPRPGLEIPVLESADVKTNVIEDKGLVAPAAMDGWTTIMSEGFEGVFPNSIWRVSDSDGSTNGEYYWDDEAYMAHSGGWSAWAANGGANALEPQYYNYPNNMSSWMIYGPFDLSNATDANLLFSYWNRSETNYDYFWWVASVDGRNFYGTAVSGDSGGWRNVTFDLKAVPTLGNLMGRSSVWIGFYFGSDYSVTDKGPFVDDVILQKLVNTTVTCPNQYKAEYFNNRTLSGSPTFTRCENWPINQNWGTGGPGNGVGNDNFSVRWTGTANFASGNHVFTARADDGINVWLDNNQIINGWVDQGPTAYASVRNVTAGQHTIKVEYYENGGGALAEFAWFLPQPNIDAARNQLKTIPEMTNPWKQVNAPIQNSSDQRHAEKYYSVVEQFEVTWQEFKGRYQPSTAYPDTRCNIYAGDVMRAMRVPLPTKGELGLGASGSQWTDPMTANAKNLNEFFNGQRSSTNSANNGWRSIDPTTTQGLQQLIAHVNAGKPALASNTGHIAVIRPAQDGVTRWQDLRIAQAGARNFLNDRLEVGFGTGNRPQFFIRD